jgi:hypothetical protein
MNRATAIIVLVWAQAAGAATFYISPSGNDSNGGTDSAPWQTFRKAFSGMAGGDTLVLMDGTYTTTTTGVICDCPGATHHASAGGRSAAPPDGVDRNQMTRILAQNPGRAVLVGIGLDISLNPASASNNADYTDFNNRAGKLGNHGGQSIPGGIAPLHRAHHIYIEGLQFVNGGFLVDVGSWIYLKSCGFEDHNAGGWGDTGFWLVRIGRNPWATISDPAMNRALRTDHVLIEDGWIAGAERGYLGIQHADYSAGRRIVIRGDCKAAGGGCASGGGEPHVGTTFYHASNNSLQNVFALDFIGSFRYTSPRTGAVVTQDYTCTFCTANHRGDLVSNGVTVDVPHGLNSVLGSGAFNVPGRALEMDPDIIWTRMPFVTIRDFVSFNHERNYTDRAVGYSAMDIALDNTGYNDPLGYTPDPSVPQAVTERISAILTHTECGSSCGAAMRYQITSANLMTRWSAKNILVYSPAGSRAGFQYPFSMSLPTFTNALGPAVTDVDASASFWSASGSTTLAAQCSSGQCLTTDPTTSSPKALVSPLRVEPGSFLSGTAQNGDDIGANITVRYGCDGCFPGDPGFDTRTANSLWPLPIEARAKVESCLDWSSGTGQAVVRPARFGSTSPDKSYCDSSVPDITTYLSNAMGGGLTTSKTASMLQLTTPALTATAGASVAFTATVSSTQATGSVSFYDGSASIGSASLSSGVAGYSTSSLAAGTHSIKAVYAGDSSLSGSTSNTLSVTINSTSKSSTSTRLTAAAASVNAGAPVTLTASVSPSSATGTIQFFNGSASLGSATLSSGVATLTTSSLAGGGNTLTASYSGDATFGASSSAAVTVTVVQMTSSVALTTSVNPATAGAAVTFTATVSPSSATGTVQFFDGSTSLGSATLSKGTAVLTTTALTSGSHTITASYSGDSISKPSLSSPINKTVGGVSSATTLRSNVNPVPYSATVTFSASVSPATATGTVQFFDGATLIGQAALSSGTASFGSRTLSVGSHNITAKYAGDTVAGASSSAVYTQIVTRNGTKTGLSSSVNPAKAGTAVVLTASISSTTATGTVTFKDGSTVLGTAPVSGGAAQYTTTAMAAGVHSLTAVYSGDANWIGSTSAVLSETIQ